MHWIDFTIVGVFMFTMLGIGFYLSRRAGKSTDEFILAGRNMPWWLAGTSLLATGLNASSMLQDSRKVRQDGLGGLWFSWRSIISASVGSVFFSRLWRRAGFVTQMEFYHARYAGWRADSARLFDTVLYGMISAPMWAAIGLVGMKKVAAVLLGLEPTFNWLGYSWSTDLVVVLSLVVVTLIYSAASGVHGVVWTDLGEAFIALVATYALLIIIYVQVGGPSGLNSLLSGHEDSAKLMSLVPWSDDGSGFRTVVIVFGFFIVFSLLEQGGYNPHIQRSLCVKNEREVMRTTIYSGVMNFAVKSWPYYICGLAGLFLISEEYLLTHFPAAIAADGTPTADFEMVFPALVTKYLPVGLVGLMVTGFLSAFMSSFDTNIHNSTSIFTNDLYRSYLAKGKTDSHYVAASRWYMVFATVVASAIGIMVNDILLLFIFLLGVMQSVGLVKLLRFVWWRTNGWGELVAQVFSIGITSLILLERILLQFGCENLVLFDGFVRMAIQATGLSVTNDTFYVFRTLALVGTATTASVVAILLTKPEPMDKLVSFYERVRPFGVWGPVRAHTQVKPGQSDHLGWLTGLSMSMMAVIFGCVFAFLGILLARWVILGFSLPVVAIGFMGFFYTLKKLYPEESEALIPAPLATS